MDQLLELEECQMGEIHRAASKYKLANALVCKKMMKMGPPQDRRGRGQRMKIMGPHARQAWEGADWREDLLRRTEYRQTRNCVQNKGLCDNRQTFNDRPRREHRMPTHLNDYVMG